MIDKKIPRKESLNSSRRNDSNNYQNNKWTAKDDIPKFMGMPIYGASKNSNNDHVQDHDSMGNSDDFARNVKNARKSSIDISSSSASAYGQLRSRSRSVSRTRMNSISRSSLNMKMW